MTPGGAGARLFAEDLFHRLPLGEFVDEFVEVADLAHYRLLISSTRTPHTTPIIRKRDGFSFGACAKKSPKLVFLAASSAAWLWR